MVVFGMMLLGPVGDNMRSVGEPTALMLIGSSRFCRVFFFCRLTAWGRSRTGYC